MAKSQIQRKISRASQSTSSLTSSWTGQAESPMSSFMMSSSPSTATLASASSSGPAEDRHILFCGGQKSGKTSLVFTLGRGFFPPEDFILPGRFDGWSVSATVTPNPVNSSSEISKKQKPTFYSLTMWEDRPRLNLFETQLAEKRKQRQDEKLKENSSEEANKVETEATTKAANGNIHKGSHGSNAHNGSYHGLRIHYPTNSKQYKSIHNDGNQSASSPSSSSTSSDGATLDLNDSFDESLLPPRPLLAPEPDVLVLCYSVDSPESFSAAEREISSELRDRFPGVPLILVATKSDLLPTDQHLPQSEHSDGCQLGNGDEELEAVLDEVVTGTPEDDILQPVSNETKEEEEDCIWAMDDGGGSQTLKDPSSSNLIHPHIGHALAKKIGARIFLECSAKEGQGLIRILEEAVWALIVKNTNPLMAAFVAGAGSMSGNLAASSSPNPTIGSLRKISDVDGSNGSSSWTSISSLIKNAAPLSTSWPRSPPQPTPSASGSSPTSTLPPREEKSTKSRKSSTTSNGSLKSCPNILSLGSRPNIFIEQPFLMMQANNIFVSPSSSSRLRKSSYSALAKKFFTPKLKEN